MHEPLNQVAAFPRRGTLSSSPAAIAFGGLIALAVAVGIGRFAFTPILPMMLEDAGLSVADGGWLASANYVGYLLGALTAIRVQARPAAVIRGGLVVTGLATLAMGVGHSFAAWMVLRALAGFMSAWVLIFASAWCLGRLTPAGRPVLNGTVFAGVGAGIASAGALCIALMHMHVGSARTWEVFGVISLVLTACIWPVFGTADGAGDGARRQDTAAAASGAAAVWTGESIRLILCYGIFGFGYIIPATFLPVMAKQAIHDPAIFGWSWPVFGAAALVSTVAAALRPKTTSNRRLWILCHLAMAVGTALPVFRDGIATIMLAALLVGGTFMVITMVGMQEAREIAGPGATSLMAAMTAAFAAGQIIGPLCVSSVAGGGGFGTALLVACFLLVASAWALSRGGAGGKR
ncbi:MAG TPA: YbfB/YjiJ family MFS transporter [Stellaceae bacterium]|jgi:predicted MFS family arabinose efflux permease